MIGESPPGHGSARRVREQRRRRRRALAACAVAALGLAGVLLWLRPWELLPPAPAVAPAAPEAPRAPAAAQEPAPPPEADGEERPGEFGASVLPPLEASDGFVRERAAAASPRPAWAQWLAGEGLVLRFVAAVDAVAHGESPRDDLPELAPRGPFAVAAQGSRSVVSEASFARYDLATGVFASLDPALCARLHRELAPLFDAALAELGARERHFDAVLARAFRELLATPVPKGALEVVAKVKSHEFADPELEALSPAQKQLLRMGPLNAGRVQQKLRELEGALGLAEAR